MDYKTLCLLKDAVDTFDDAEFVSVLDESHVAVKNNNTGDIWKIEYRFDEDKLSFSTVHAVVLEENEVVHVDPREEMKKAVAHSLFSEDNIGLDYVRELIESDEDIFNKKFSASSDSYSESVEDEDETLVFNEAIDYSPEERSFIVEMANRWEQKSDEYARSKKEFMSAGFLFEGASVRSEDEIPNPLDLITALNEKKENIKAVMENQQAMFDFTEAVGDILGDQELATAVMNGIDFSQDKKKIETSLSKNLVIAKRDFNEDYNVREKLKAIMEMADQLVLESGGQGIYGNENRYSYLRTTAGFWTRRDLNALMSDFDQILGDFVNLNRDEQMAIQEMKDTVDHMYRTNQIVDEVVNGVIQSFNEMYFVKAQGRKDAFFDQGKSGPDTTGRAHKAYHRSIAPGSV